MNKLFFFVFFLHFLLTKGSFLKWKNFVFKRFFLKGIETNDRKNQGFLPGIFPSVVMEFEPEFLFPNPEEILISTNESEFNQTQFEEFNDFSDGLFNKMKNMVFYSHDFWKIHYNSRKLAQQFLSRIWWFWKKIQKITEKFHQ